MIKKLPFIRLLWFAGWALVLIRPAHARDLDQATNLYSQGVHAYFAGRFSDAESSLSRAIAINDRDPRVFYFRALSRLRNGRDSEARRDMTSGAALESSHLNRYAVGTALQRVQGSHRLLLEKYRRDARSRAASTGAHVAGQLAEQINTHDSGVLRKPVIIPLDEFLRPGAPEALSADEVARRASAAQHVPATAIQMADAPGTSPPASVVDNPFRDDAPADAPPADASPGDVPESAVDSSPPGSSEAIPPAETSPAEVDEGDDNPFDF